MKTDIQETKISTSRQIKQLGLPAHQQRKALETLALVNALASLLHFHHKD